MIFYLHSVQNPKGGKNQGKELAGACTVLKMVQKSMQIATVQLIFSEK
jgi:hypothetical protein